MSIIYDALQKTQRNRNNISIEKLDAVTIPRSNRLKLSLLIVFGLLAITFFIYQRLSEDSLLNQKLHAKNLVAPQHFSALKVNGVFVSHKIKMAMVNHEMYHIGETIGDMKIIGIETDKVIFQNPQGTFDLGITA